MSKKYKLIFAILALATAVASLAEEKAAVKEEPAPPTLPAPAKRFLDFYSAGQLSFAIDPDSISIQPGADQEVRYTLRAISKQGAVNLSYEGIRCSNRQKIIYAVGLKDGRWSLVRSPEWSAIYIKGLYIPHGTLANGYFCSVTDVAGKVSDIVHRIESHKALNDPSR
ncbi:hypothetical protein AAKU67_001838 [Oxalobacteraceae bacterium GrIS 2.11]